VSHQSRSFKQDLAALLWSAGIACLLLLPGEMLEPRWLEPLWLRLAEEAAHGVLFFGMAILVQRARLPRGGSAGAATIATCLAYAILLELLQIPVPGRGFETIDIVVAALGIFAAVGLTGILVRSPRVSGGWSRTSMKP